MKKLAFFSFATLAVLLSSCADLTSVENTESETNTIAAVMEGVQTKTSTTDEGHFSWLEGDNIWLETTADYVLGMLSAGAGTPNATFNYGSFFGDLTGKSVYPYNEGHSVEGDVLNVVLPASYDLGSNLNNTNSPMYGVNVGGTLKFNHLAGVMRFSFKNVPAGVDRFVFTVDKKINGTFAADLTADYPVLQTEATQADAERTVTFNFDALANTSDVKIFVPLPLGTYESLELALYKGEEAVWTYSKAVTNTINRKSLKIMPTVSMGGSIGGDIENDGTIGGDIEGEELYISIAANSANVACDVTSNNDLYVNSNAEELAFEALTDSPWISIALCKGSTDDKWIVEASMTENTTTENRTAQFKVYIKDNSEKYVVVEYGQYGAEIYIRPASSDQYRDIESCGMPEDWIYFFTNVQEVVVEIPEEATWITNIVNRPDYDIHEYYPERWFSIFKISENNTTQERKATVKIYASVEQDKYIEYHFTQQPSEIEYYISSASGNNFTTTNVLWDSTNDNNVLLNSNAEELAFEALTDSPWISIVLCKGNSGDNWIVEANMTENKTSENRSAQFKVYIKDHSEKYVVIEYTQEASTTFFADYVDEFGVNHSKGTLIDGVIWAPVNCGYHAEDYTYGKLYQWGRKYGQGYDESYTGLYDATYPTKDNGQLIEGTVTIAEGLSEANKDNFYCAPSGSYYKNWWNEGTTLAQYANLWNAGTATEPVKSDSDPCPEGWRVPTLSEAQNLLKNYSSWVEYNGQNGYWFSGSTTYSENSPKVFLPATGERSGGGGAYAYNRRYIGCYWTSDRSGYFYFENGRVVFSTNTVYSYNGDAVRCVQE